LSTLLLNYFFFITQLIPLLSAFYVSFKYAGEILVDRLDFLYYIKFEMITNHIFNYFSLIFPVKRRENHHD